MLDDFRDKLGAEKLNDVENSFNLWNALRAVAPQTVMIESDTRLVGTRDKAGLLNVLIELNHQNASFVFDTGANLSTVTASTANRLKLQILETSVSVGSSTDNKVNSKLAVGAILKIGRVVLRNAVFLVLEDQTLFFPQIDYQISGIIGLSIIKKRCARSR